MQFKSRKRQLRSELSAFDTGCNDEFLCFNFYISIYESANIQITFE